MGINMLVRVLFLQIASKSRVNIPYLQKMINFDEFLEQNILDYTESKNQI